MKTSMITSCCHNYCSLCIRKSLLYKAQCPACFEDAFDYQLRNNRILDDIIEVFVRLSAEVETFMQNYRKLSESQNKVNIKLDFIQNSSSKPDSREINNVNNESSSQRDTRAAFENLSESTNSLLTSSYVPESENMGTKVDLSDGCDYVSLQNASSVKHPHQSPARETMVSKGKMPIPSLFSIPENSNTSSSLVPCPVCNIDIPERNINVHLDACLKRSEHTAQHSSPTKVQKRKPLPKLVYSLLHEKELRKMLKQKGLSTHGDRKALISRHQRFTLLYNSENDTLNPRSIADLIKQIEREEQEENKVCSVSTTWNKLKIDRKTDPKLIQQAQHRYMQQNKASFENLIQSIKKREAEKKTAVEQNLVVNDGKDARIGIAVDVNKETCAQKEVDQKTPMESCGTVTEAGHAMVVNGIGLCEPSVSMSPTDDTANISNVGGNVNCNENIIETAFHMNYETDTEEAVSPVLGRNIATVCAGDESENYSKGESTQNLSLDMFEKSFSRSGVQKCGSPVQKSKEIEREENSDSCNNQNFSLLAEHTQETTLESNLQNTACEVHETLAARRMHKRLISQLDDPDIEHNSEDNLSDFEVREMPIRRRRKTTRKSPQPSSSKEERILRKRVKR
ncbi:postreplication repair E3 ubiquitin-protein ligase rad18-like isoform X2 [Zootermopsis nevadensis]|nr:postreplication repair E3 ubiquitin-protein ligase rad18-like isoform X2 [Zootermopsis nevadensis]